jgi:hypothetical protein
MRTKDEIVEDIVSTEADLELIYVKKSKLTMGPSFQETIYELLEQEEKLVDKVTDLKKLLTEYQ